MKYYKYPNRLRELREEFEYTQGYIAKKLGISQQQYSLYENSIRLIPIDKLIILAILYDTSLDYIVGLTNERKAYTRCS